MRARPVGEPRGRARGRACGIACGMVILLALLVAPDAAWPGQDDSPLDGLFQRLRVTADAVDANELEARIWRIWLRFSDARVTDLMAGGIRRMDGGHLAEARDVFTQITRLAPKFAEGWNKLATVDYLLRDFGASAHGIARTLALEPRHFGALSGLGLVNMALDRPARALKSFRQALKIHPHMPGVRRNIKQLQKRLKDEEI